MTIYYFWKVLTPTWLNQLSAAEMALEDRGVPGLFFTDTTIEERSSPLDGISSIPITRNLVELSGLSLTFF